MYTVQVNDQPQPEPNPKHVAFLVLLGKKLATKWIRGYLGKWLVGYDDRGWIGLLFLEPLVFQ